MTNNLTPRPEVRGAIVGVDTHKHIHVAVAIDTCGIHLGDQSFAADSGGYQALLTWAETHGRIQAFGIAAAPRGRSRRPAYRITCGWRIRKNSIYRSIFMSREPEPSAKFSRWRA